MSNTYTSACKECKSAASSSPLRVLLVAPDYPPALGGIQSLLYNITSAMPSAETRVVTLDNPDAQMFDDEQHQIIDRVRISVARASLRHALFNAAVALNPPNWRPDVVLNGHVVSGLAAAVLAKRYDAKNVLYTYGKEIVGRPGMTKWALKRSDAAIAISEFTRSLLIDVVGKESLPAPVSIIHPGVAIPPRPGSPKNARPTIVTIARLRDAYKGHDMILDSLPAVLSVIPEAQWIVIGEGEMKSTLEGRARSLGLGESIRFLGAVSDKERDYWLASAHVFAMPSRYPKNAIGGEGFGIVYMEAAAWGVPSIAGNIGASCEAVLDQETGLLVDPECSADIAQALIRLLSDGDYAHRLGKHARLRADTSFRWEQVGAQLENMLSATVQAGKR